MAILAHLSQAKIILQPAQSTCQSSSSNLLHAQESGDCVCASAAETCADSLTTHDLRRASVECRSGVSPAGELGSSCRIDETSQARQSSFGGGSRLGRREGAAVDAPVDNDAQALVCYAILSRAA